MALLASPQPVVSVAAMVIVCMLAAIAAGIYSSRVRRDGDWANADGLLACSGLFVLAGVLYALASSL